MKKLVLIVLAIAFVGFSANAQDCKMKPHQKNKQEKGMMFQQLNLSEAQKEKMKANRESFKKQMQELNKNEKITVKEARDRRDALKKAQKESMLAILTADQKKQLESIKLQKREEHAKIAAEKLEKLKAKLSLTDDQVVKIKANREAVQAQLKAIKEDEKLSRTEKQEKLTALREKNKGSIKQFLTPAQIQKMEEMKLRKEKKDKKDS